MANFDITKAAARAYQTSWIERRYLLKLATVPFLLKTICYLLAFSYGFEDNFIRLTLCLLPALFTEGWMLSHFVRLIFLGHRWPFKPSGDFQKDMPLLRIRARGVMAGLLVYVLINMVLGLMLSLVSQLMPPAGTDPATLPESTGFLLMMLLGFSFWGFRLTWLYIPYAINLDVKYYLHVLRGPFVSFSLIGAWLMCIMPFFLFIQIVGGMLHTIAKGGTGDPASSFLFIIVIMAVDTLKIYYFNGGNCVWPAGYFFEGKNRTMKIHVTDQNGVAHELEGIEGWRVMEIIKDHGLPIKAECGGCCACATCHVYVDAAWVDKLYPMRDDEQDLLDTAPDVTDRSRLSCQILMSEELDGLTLTLAPGSEL